MVTDYDKVRTIQKRLAKYANGSPDFFCTMRPVHLSKEHFKEIESTPYFVASRPSGRRCFLYVNEMEEIFLQSSSLHIFQMEQKYANELFPVDRQNCKDTLLDVLLLDRRKNNADDSEDDSDFQQLLTTTEDLSDNISETKTGVRYKFFIIDAVRVGGLDLTELSIDKRISIAKVRFSWI